MKHWVGHAIRLIKGFRCTTSRAITGPFLDGRVCIGAGCRPLAMTSFQVLRCCIMPHWNTIYFVYHLSHAYIDGCNSTTGFYGTSGVGTFVDT